MDVNTQCAIMAVGFFVSASIVMLAVALLFNMCCECKAPTCCSCTVMDEDGCCYLTVVYLCYRFTPCCMRDWRESLRKNVDEMRVKLNSTHVEEGAAQPPAVICVKGDH